MSVGVLTALRGTLLRPALFSVLAAFTGEDAPMYKSVPVQEPQYKEDFLRCESGFISSSSALMHAIAVAARFPARVPLDQECPNFFH